MVKSFQFTPTPTILFGVGKRKDLPQIIHKYGDNALIITGAGSLNKSEVGKQLLETLKKDVKSSYFEEVSGEPTPEIVDQITNKFKNTSIDIVVAIGGGSVLDAGKAVSAMLGKNESVFEYLEGVGSKQPNGTKTPFIALPTTSGTGSETTKNAVISRIGVNGFKKSLRHDNYIPDIALVDPELTIGCPRNVTAASGLDAFTQLLEAFVSTKSTNFIDALTYEGLQHVVQNLKESWENGANLEARTGMSYAAMLSGIALANSGLGTVHGFASSVGGVFEIPHSVVCGTLMAECVRFNVQKLRHIKSEAYYKYAKIGRLFSSDLNKSEDYYCDLLVDSIQQLTDEMQIPKLSAFGMKKNHIPDIVSTTENKNNPVALTPEDLSKILENRL
jgi:alcohol dehydrogenase class IV